MGDTLRASDAERDGAFGSMAVRSKPKLGKQILEGARRWAERLSRPPE